MVWSSTTAYDRPQLTYAIPGSVSHLRAAAQARCRRGSAARSQAVHRARRRSGECGATTGRPHRSPTEGSVPVSEDGLPLPWLRRAHEPTPGTGAAPGRPLRCALYGRVSTEDQQDSEDSRLWQRGRAEALIAPTGGTIVADYFGIGQPRALPWRRRPHAQELLAALADRNRGFAQSGQGCRGQAAPRDRARPANRAHRRADLQ